MAVTPSRAAAAASCRDADAAQVAVLLEAARLGADIFEAFVNSPPYFWTVSGSSRYNHSCCYFI
jgi:hypothetical protein